MNQNTEYASPPCDVVGCTNPSIDCIGGEVYYCADHEAGAYDAYAEKAKRQAAQIDSSGTEA